VWPYARPVIEGEPAEGAGVPTPPGLVVAIDGPAGSGKSTVAGMTARRLGLAHLDTGAMYRVVAARALERGVAPEDADALAAIAEGLDIDFSPKGMIVDGHPAGPEIRSPAVDRIVSAVSSHRTVREALVRVQRALMARGGIVAEGRDIGTVVCPEAPVKVFLIASIQERARRRARDLGSAGHPVNLDTLRGQIEDRDHLDSTRVHSPLVPAPDAVVIDTTGKTPEEVVEEIAALAAEASPSAIEPAARARSALVAVVGRANVGKSTLVNRLVGRRAAIEHPEPGVTRDRQAYEVEWTGRRFGLVDTGGWEPRAKGLAAKVLAQAERAAHEADLILMVVDAQTGAVEDDLVVARKLRRADVPVLLVANKVDSAAHEAELGALERLGLGPALPVSASHGRGSGDLLDVIIANIPEPSGEAAIGPEELAIAIVGRPNVGKSSLFNRLVGADRSIVHDMPGTTRDTVDVVATMGDRVYRFIDTAGMRRRAKGAQGPEYYGLVRSLRAIDAAHVVVHLIDANEGPTDQDQRIAKRIVEAGRAGIVVVNKWDLVPGEAADDVAAWVRDQMRFISWSSLIRTSALTGRGVKRILPAIEGAHASWEQRVPTAALNTWLRETLEHVPLGQTRRARPTKIRYVTQSGVRPPTFVFFASGQVTASGLRGLENRLRARFGFEGTPLRLHVRVAGRGRR